MMNEFHRQTRWIFGIFLAALLVTGAAIMLPSGDMYVPWTVPRYLAGAAVMLVAFGAAVVWKQTPLVVIAVAAVAVRLLLLGQAPGGDIYRYLWEGERLLTHTNPYLHEPDSPLLIPERDALWGKVEHKPFSAIYPPLAEWIFAVIASLSASVFFFKLVIAAADLLAGGLLWKRFGGGAALLYLWNPLVICSFAGSGHYDSFFLLALVLGWLAWESGRSRAALVWVGCAVAIKWMALPLLGWAMWRTLRTGGFRAGMLAALLGFLPLALSFAAVGLWTGEWTWRMYPEKFSEEARSLDLVPRWIGWVWQESRSSNSWLLPVLGAAWAVVIFRARTFRDAAEWTLFLTLAISPMVHGWYFTWLIPFAVASRNLGTLLVTATSFIYFMVYHRLSTQPELGWIYLPWEVAFLWTPFVLGFLWTYRPQEKTPPAGEPAL